MLKKGFTLIELLIVICIIGIFVALIIPHFYDFEDRSNLKYDKQLEQTINLNEMKDSESKQ